MPIAEKDVVWIEAPKLGLADKLYLPAIAEGLRTTIGHIFKPNITEQYPEQKPDLPPNYRGVHRLNRDDQGRVKCVACYMCATACPAHCIDIVSAPAPKEWTDREKYPETFVIDELRCIYCGMCEEACPVDSIELTSLFDLTGLSREQMIFDKEKLLSVWDQTHDTPKDPVRTHGGHLGPASELRVIG
jgi:NADH-quinone oxidoreductase subunit I